MVCMIMMWSKTTKKHNGIAAVSIYIVITSLVYTDVRVSVVNASSRHSAGLKSVLFGDQIKLFGLLGLQLDFFSLLFVSFRLEPSYLSIHVA